MKELEECEHDWYPVKLELESAGVTHVYRVCRKCWGHDNVLSLFVGA